MLWQFRRWFVNVYWLIPLCTVFILLGCDTEKTVMNSEASASMFDGESLYRGLFLAHGEVADRIPEIRDYIKIENFVTNEEELRSVIKVHDRIVSSIKHIEPSFFDGFKRAMHSGDHLAIQAQLNEAAQMTMLAVSRFPEYQQGMAELNNNPEELEQEIARLNQGLDEQGRIDADKVGQTLKYMSEEPRSENMKYVFDSESLAPVVLWYWVVYVVAAIDIAVVSNVAFAIAAISAIALEYDVVETDGDEAGGGIPVLLQEQIINSIAVNFKADR